jgi:uncharacterized protein (TIGR00369 family)
MNNREAAEPIPLGHGTQNHCFGCGDQNASGLKLRFFLDAAAGVICRLTLDPRFQGPPGYAHGGIIATLLDEAMSKANRRRNVYAMTRQMAVEYLRPVPLGAELILEGQGGSQQGRKHNCTATLRDQGGRVLATATGLFIEVRRERLVDAEARTAAAP